LPLSGLRRQDYRSRHEHAGDYGHLRELFGIDVSLDLISTVTGAVLEEVAAWQQRALDPT
jgi:hypothetical protein